jgi:hypothetical protein
MLAAIHRASSRVTTKFCRSYGGACTDMVHAKAEDRALGALEELLLDDRPAEDKIIAEFGLLVPIFRAGIPTVVIQPPSRHSLARRY